MDLSLEISSSYCTYRKTRTEAFVVEFARFATYARFVTGYLLVLLQNKLTRLEFGGGGKLLGKRAFRGRKSGLREEPHLVEMED